MQVANYFLKLLFVTNLRSIILLLIFKNPNLIIILSYLHVIFQKNGS